METVIEVQIHGNNDVVLCGDTYNKRVKNKQSSAASALEKNKTGIGCQRGSISFFCSTSMFFHVNSRTVIQFFIQRTLVQHTMFCSLMIFFFFSLLQINKTFECVEHHTLKIEEKREEKKEVQFQCESLQSSLIHSTIRFIFVF